MTLIAPAPRFCARAEALATGLDRARRIDPDAIAVIAIAAPAAAPEALLSAFRDCAAMLWDPPGDWSHAGLGAAIHVRAAGRDRFDRVRVELARTFARITAIEIDGIAPQPRALGGFAFAPGAASAAPWQAFGDASWILPRWSYRVGAQGAWLELAVTRAEAADPRWVRELDRVVAALEDYRRPPRTGCRAALEELHPDRWREQVEGIRRAIVARRCEKIVAARCTRAVLDRSICPEAVLARLGERYPDCHRFAFRRGGLTFAGATPERLIAKRGDAVATQALAGSIASGAGASSALLSSAKDRGEQHLVVTAIAAALAPLCDPLHVADTPRVRALRHVLHLETPIAGRLRRPTHLFELGQALHPTPAVGGVPTTAALRWIDQHEPADRGWYAAPIGWVDGRGDGELAVAIRSALLSDRAAFVYAGAGIVRPSDPDAEYVETRIKQRAILDALGVIS